MRSFVRFIILLLSLSLLTSCGVTETEEDNGKVEFIMKAELLSLGEKLEVNVTEAEYASGIFHIIISPDTEIFSASGERIDAAGLSRGDLLTITYSGQVMMSYPPQTVALKITVA